MECEENKNNTEDCDGDELYSYTLKYKMLYNKKCLYCLAKQLFGNWNDNSDSRHSKTSSISAVSQRPANKRSNQETHPL